MIEQERALRITKSLIENKYAALDTKFFESHHKVAIFYKDHCLEIKGDDKKVIKYSGLEVPITKTQYKDIMNLFMEEIKRRKHDAALEKFNDLEELVDSKN
jgi:hypothetical protein